MTRIALDRETAARLRAAGGPVELTDPDGVPLATATPSNGPPPAELWTAEELAAIKASLREPGPRYSLAEAWEKIFAEHGRPEQGA